MLREINIQLLVTAADGWTQDLQYPTAVDANGNPTAWAHLSKLGDDTSGLIRSGRIWWDPPSDWKPIRVNGSAPMYYVRFLSTSSGTSPVARTILGRDYTGARGGTSGVVPAFDPAADLNHDGYLNDTEYAHRAAGMDARFLYESRAVYDGYGEMRFTTDPSDGAFQLWAINYMQRFLQGRPSVVGLFVDNSVGTLPDGFATVRESVTWYTNDYTWLLGAIARAVAPRLVMANTASGGQVSRIDGYFRETALQPLADPYYQFESVAASVASLSTLR